MMLSRSVEGIIAVDTPFEEGLPVPIVSVSGHKSFSGVVNIESGYLLDATNHKQ
jgi:LacI family transcriptional regulator